jgi:hypothetical protein
MVSYWLLVVIGLLIAQGLCSCCGMCFLSEGVMITILGGATATVIGLLMVAAGYLFPKTPWWLAPTHPARSSARPNGRRSTNRQGN